MWGLRATSSLRGSYWQLVTFLALSSSSHCQCQASGKDGAGTQLASHAHSSCYPGAPELLTGMWSWKKVLGGGLVTAARCGSRRSGFSTTYGTSVTPATAQKQWHCNIRLSMVTLRSEIISLDKACAPLISACSHMYVHSFYNTGSELLQEDKMMINCVLPS